MYITNNYKDEIRVYLIIPMPMTKVRYVGVSGIVVTVLKSRKGCSARIRGQCIPRKALFESILKVLTVYVLIEHVPHILTDVF